MCEVRVIEEADGGRRIDLAGYQRQVKTVAAFSCGFEAGTKAESEAQTWAKMTNWDIGYYRETTVTENRLLKLVAS